MLRRCYANGMHMLVAYVHLHTIMISCIMGAVAVMEVMQTMQSMMHPHHQ
jgi:hypothetical protein